MNHLNQLFKKNGVHPAEHQKLIHDIDQYYRGIMEKEIEKEIEKLKTKEK